MKRHFEWILPAVALVAVIYYIGYSDSAKQIACNPLHDTFPSTFVVTAFDIERDAILERVSVQSSCTIDDTLYYIVESGNELFVVYMSGMGPEAAADTTENTLDTFDVELLVFSGVAGGVEESLEIGETVVVETWHDFATSTIAIDAALISDALLYTNATTVPAGITLDHFVSDTSELPDGMSIVDMESYTVASIAESRGVPFIAFRSVSDEADGTLSEENLTRAARASAVATTRFIDERE